MRVEMIKLNTKRWLVGIPLIIFSAMFTILPALSHGDDDDDHDNAEASQGYAIVGDTAKLAIFQASIDEINQKMNASFHLIEPMIKNSCYDCHSDQTSYPWYHSLPLVGGWIDEHVEEAREHLDFTYGFPLKGKGSQLKLFDEIVEEVEEGEMPLCSYRCMHWGAAIEDEQLDSLKGWFKGFEQLIRTTHGFYKQPLPKDAH